MPILITTNWLYIFCDTSNTNDTKLHKLLTLLYVTLLSLVSSKNI